MSTHGVPVQRTIIYSSEEPGSFSLCIEEYACLRGLSKADAKGEIMRLGMAVIMGNVYHNVAKKSPKAAALDESMSGIVAQSLVHILTDVLPSYGEMFIRLLEGTDVGPALGTVTATGAHGARVDMPDCEPVYRSGMEGVNVTIVRGGPPPKE